MKPKFLNLIWLMAGGGVALSSCNNYDDVGRDSPRVAVQFGSQIGEAQTRTTVDGSQWIQGDKVGIYMLKNGQALSAAHIVDGATNLEYQAQVGNVATSSFTPVSGNPVFYPQNGDKVDFIAYYPHTTSITSDYKYPVDVRVQSKLTAINVLYARTAATNNNGYNKNSSIVDLRFKPALSKVSFSLIPGDGSPDLSDAQITISNLYQSADMVLADGSFSNFGNIGVISANTYTHSAIVVPQTSSNSQLTITLPNSNETFAWSFPSNTTFEQGKEHQYTLTVSRTGIQVTDFEITVWNGITSSPTNINSQEVAYTYKVGDYYPVPDNKNSAIGVVIWLDNQNGYDSVTKRGSHGRVVSLDEAQLTWGPAVSLGATSENGRVNMLTVYTKNGNSFDNYPVFAWVHAKNPSGVTYSSNAQGIWYLPSKVELYQLRVAWNGSDAIEEVVGAHANFNLILTEAGGQEMATGTFCSSTEFLANRMEGLQFYSGIIRIEYKTGNFYCRAFLAF